MSNRTLILACIVFGTLAVTAAQVDNEECLIEERYCPSGCKVAREIEKLDLKVKQVWTQLIGDLETSQRILEVANIEWETHIDEASYIRTIRDSLTTVGRRGKDAENVVNALQLITSRQTEELARLQDELSEQQVITAVLESELEYPETNCPGYCATSGAALSTSITCNGHSCVEESEPAAPAAECNVIPAQTGYDCANLYNTGHRVSGPYSIQPVGGDRFIAYCDMESDGGGWTVVQRRNSGQLDFDRTWEEYATGFGDDDQRCSGEYWLGNEKLVRLTRNNFLTVRFELTDWSGEKRVAEYYYFRVNDDHKFTVQISQYQEQTSNISDSITGWGYIGAHRRNPNNMKFTTRDNDNDRNEVENCAQLNSGRHGAGGWWHNSCFAANINGHYYHGGHYNSEGITDGDGIIWPTWRGASYSLKATEMKVRPNTFHRR